MSEEPKKVDVLFYLKEFSSLARDILITLLIAICFFQPSYIKTFLKESGLSKFGGWGFTVEVAEEKEIIAKAQEKVTAQVVASTSTKPDEAPVEASNKPVDPNFKEAILKAERVAPQILPSAGWVFLGRVDKNKTQWQDGGSPTTTAAWPIKPDDVLTVKDDVYIRAVTNDQWHSKAPVTTVSKIGDKLKVVELDYSSAKAGGFFVWAKVVLQTN